MAEDGELEVEDGEPKLVQVTGRIQKPRGSSRGLRLELGDNETLWGGKNGNGELVRDPNGDILFHYDKYGQPRAIGKVTTKKAVLDDTEAL